MVTWPVVRTRSSHLCPVRSPFVSLLLRALGVVQPSPCRVPGLFILHAGGLMVHLEVDDNFCFSLQVVFRYSRLRALRSMCAAGRRSHTFTRCLHVRLFTLARVLSCSMEFMVLMCFLREVVFPIHTGVPDGSSVVARPGYCTSHPTSTQCPSVDGTSFPRIVARTLMKRGSMQCRADHRPHGDRKHPWPPGRGEMAMAPLARCFPCRAWVV